MTFFKGDSDSSSQSEACIISPNFPSPIATKGGTHEPNGEEYD